MIFVPQLNTPTDNRRGVVLLVVIALLTLFASVGLSFVFYAEAEGTAAQYTRDSVSGSGVPDMNPEALMSYALGQMLYDADDTSGVSSALRGHSLARTMWGYNYVTINGAPYLTTNVSSYNTPYNGIGNLHYTIGNPNTLMNTGANTADNFNYVNRTYYPTDVDVIGKPLGIRDPERYGVRGNGVGAPGSSTNNANTLPQTNTYVAGNPSYTYADTNMMLLSAVNANGEILLQTAHRPWLSSNPGDPSNPSDPYEKYRSLFPSPTWHPPQNPLNTAQGAYPAFFQKKIALSVSLVNGGNGYAVGNVLAVSGGALFNNVPTQLTVTGVGMGGAITTAFISQPGNYTASPANPVSTVNITGTGAGATFAIGYRWGTVDSDLGGDVRNWEFGPGTPYYDTNTNPGTGIKRYYLNNDSFWMDLGFPVMTAPNGQKFKPMFAFLVTDLDSKINVNMAGNIRGVDPNGNPFHASNQGFGPWEISLAQLLGGPWFSTNGAPPPYTGFLAGTDWANLFRGNGARGGRYGPNPSLNLTGLAYMPAPNGAYPPQTPPFMPNFNPFASVGGIPFPMPNPQASTTVIAAVVPAYPSASQPTTPFYGYADFDAVSNAGGNLNLLSPKYLLPGDAGNTLASFYPFPNFDFSNLNTGASNSYQNGNVAEGTSHPSLFNINNPRYFPSFVNVNGARVPNNSANLPWFGIPPNANPLLQSEDQVFGWSNLEAMYRYGGTASSGLTSDLARLAPMNFGGVTPTAVSGAGVSPIQVNYPNHGLTTGKQVVVSGVQGNTAANGTWTVAVLTSSSFALYAPSIADSAGQAPQGLASTGNGPWVGNTGTFFAPWRPRLSTVASFDLDVPGATPWLYPGNPTTYQLQGAYPTGISPAAPANYPSGGPVATPPFPASPGGEFGVDWRGLAGALGRLDLNQFLPNYVDATNTSVMSSQQQVTAASYTSATAARQALAKSIFDRLRFLTTGNNASVNLPVLNGNVTIPASFSPPTDYLALRWLAQLAVNIVDYLDNDDISTPWMWNNPHNENGNNPDWVFGTELPKLVINEVYSEMDNTGTDVGVSNAAATQPLSANFWVELLNPTAGQTPVNLNVPGGANPAYLLGIASSGSVVTTATVANGGASYAVGDILTVNGGTGSPAQLTVTAVNSGAITTVNITQAGSYTANPGNPASVTATTGMGAGATLTLTFSNTVFQSQATINGNNRFLPAGSPANLILQPNSWGNNNTTVSPAGSNYAGNNTQGFYVLAPNIAFPGGFPGGATPSYQVNTAPVNPTPVAAAPWTGTPTNAMAYSFPKTTTFPYPKHNLFLQRLACPYLAPQNDPTQANYNPYITVDYMSNVPVNQHVTTTGNGPQFTTFQATPTYSLGKRQPYAALSTSDINTQLVLQQPNTNSANNGPNPTAYTTSPQHTFFQHNGVEGANGNNPVNGPSNLWTIFQTAVLPNPPAPLNVNQVTNFNTLGGLSGRGTFSNGGATPTISQVGFNWLTHMDRFLVSPIELLNVSIHPPHLLTQSFVAGPRVYIKGGGGTGATATVTINPNAPYQVTGVNIVNGGSGYNQAAPPTVTFTAGSTGTATGTAVVNAGGQVTGVNITNAGGGYSPLTPFGHTGINPSTPAWFDNASRLSRVLEFLAVGPRATGVVGGSRVPGKVNINTIWDPEVLLALLDPNITSSYYDPSQVQPTQSQQAIMNLFSNMLAQRNPANMLSGSDVPFQSLATGFSAAVNNAAYSDPQNPAGSGLNNTLARSNGSATTPGLVFQALSPSAKGAGWTGPTVVGVDHPYRQMEIMNKMFNNVTTRSNVFAVFMTVGFFAVQDTNAAGQPIVPPIIGQEIGRAQGKNIRHRMFAVVDRTSMVTPPLTITAPANFGTVSAAGSQTVGLFAAGGQPGPAGLCYGTTTLNDTVNGTYNLSMNWSIQPGSVLTIDQGLPSQETITVQSVNQPTGALPYWSITANFVNTHNSGATISIPGITGPTVGGATLSVTGMPAPGYITANVPTVFGNPGPQPAYNPIPGGQPAFSARGNNAVVPYFNVIQ